MIVAGTGHRSKKLLSYTKNLDSVLLKLALDYFNEQKEITRIISGMALGWDQAIAKAGIEIGIPVIGAVPFTGQESVWPDFCKKDYYRILDHCQEVIIISEGSYSSAKYQIRNEWMVDHCNFVLALWDGSGGGTGNCIDYCKKVRIPYINMWDDFIKLVK